MIEHVRRRALDSGVSENILVASGDKEILETVKNYGGQVKQTYKKHLNGTTRIAEAVEDINCTHVIVIQGDEPLIQKEHLKKLTTAINRNPDIDSWNSISDLDSEKELNDIINKSGKIIKAIEINYKKNVMGNMRWTNDWINSDGKYLEYLFLMKKKMKIV